MSRATLQEVRERLAWLGAEKRKREEEQGMKIDLGKRLEGRRIEEEREKEEKRRRRNEKRRRGGGGGGEGVEKKEVEVKVEGSLVL